MSMHFGGLALALVVYGSAAEPGQSPAKRPDAAEGVYILRTVRESSNPPTDFCSQSRTGFDNVRAEDRYTLSSTSHAQLTV
jgi:hypothetical protein